MKFILAAATGLLAAAGPAYGSVPIAPNLGPISATFYCLLDRASTTVSSTIEIKEGSEIEVHFLGSLPTALSKDDIFLVKSETEMTLTDHNGMDRLRLLRKFGTNEGGHYWWQLSARGADNHYWKMGICLGQVPLGPYVGARTLKRLRGVTVETEGVDD